MSGSFLFLVLEFSLETQDLAQALDCLRFGVREVVVEGSVGAVD